MRPAQVLLIETRSSDNVFVLDKLSLAANVQTLRSIFPRLAAVLATLVEVVGRGSPPVS